jgi:hypothetical protein
VRNHVQLRLLGFHAGLGNEQRIDHDVFLWLSAVHAQQLAGGFIVGFSGLQQLHLLLELARGGDHADHGFDGVHVRAFDRARQQAGVAVVGQRRCPGAEQAVIAALERLVDGG